MSEWSLWRYARDVSWQSECRAPTGARVKVRRLTCKPKDQNRGEEEVLH
jgi:hypothetical protein